MSTLIKDLVTRIKIDWQEYRLYRQSVYNVKRDQKLINRAIERAKMKNGKDGKTYYIMRDKLGGINELNNKQLDFFTRQKLFKKMNYLQRLESAIGLVTSNKVLLDHYTQIQLKKEENE